MSGSRVSTTFQTFDFLGQRIVQGAYDECMPNEATLCAELGIGRGTLREASKMLVSKGLLAPTVRGRAVRPTPATTWRWLDRDVQRWLLDARPQASWRQAVHDFRCGLEPAAAALVAISARPADRRMLVKLLVQMAGELKAPDRPDIARAAFHAAVLEATGNGLYRQFIPLVTAVVSHSQSWSAPRLRKDLSWMRAIVEAIETVLVKGPRTRDLGGSASTTEIGKAIAALI